MVQDPRFFHRQSLPPMRVYDSLFVVMGTNLPLVINAEVWSGKNGWVSQLEMARLIMLDLSFMCVALQCSRVGNPVQLYCMNDGGARARNSE